MAHAYLHDRGRASAPVTELLLGVDAAHAEHHRPGSGGVPLKNGLEARLFRAVEFYVVSALSQKRRTSFRQQQQHW